MGSSKAPERYVIYGHLVGRRLPEHLDLGDVRIVKESGARLRDLSRPDITNLRANFESGAHIQGSPASFRVRSEHIVWVRLTASDEGEAVATARRDYLEPLVATLLAITGSPAFVNVSRVSRVLDNGYMPEPTTPWSDAAYMHRPMIEPMTDQQSTELVNALTAVRQDTTTRDLAANLSDGMRLLRTSGGRPANIGAALLAYFKVIERISQQTKQDKDQKARLDKEQAEIVANLARSLKLSRNTRQSVKQVRNAAQRLHRLEESTLKDRITLTCRRLGLAESVAVRAHAFADIRHGRLGHPSSNQTGADFGIAPEEAEELALTFYAADVRNRVLGNNR